MTGREWRMRADSDLANWLDYHTLAGHAVVLSTNKRVYEVEKVTPTETLMAKPSAITRAITLLRDSHEVQFNRQGFVGLDLPEPGMYRIIPIDDAISAATALKRSDARTRLDPTARAKRKPAAKRTTKRRKVAR